MAQALPCGSNPNKRRCSVPNWRKRQLTPHEKKQRREFVVGIISGVLIGFAIVGILFGVMAIFLAQSIDEMRALQELGR